MSDQKKRDWFATGDSDEEEQSYDSEIEESRGKSFAARSTKRRKLDGNASEVEDDASDEEDDAGFGKAKTLLSERSSVAGDTAGAKDDAAKDSEAQTLSVEPAGITDKDRAKAKAKRKLDSVQAKAAKTGVLYISRVPPFMKPHTLKNLLRPFAPSGLDRIFLTPEDPTHARSRIKSGGNKKKQFLDGWIEFTSKKEAKRCAEALNGRNIGGKKGSYYYDDVWNLKYLRGFKWRHLTEQIANENAEREARLRAETVKDRKEAREFLRNVERGKMLDGMEKKRAARTTTTKDVEQQAEDRGKAEKERLEFKQVEPVAKAKRTDGVPSIDAQRVLSKIF